MYNNDIENSLESKKTIALKNCLFQVMHLIISAFFEGDVSFSRFLNMKNLFVSAFQNAKGSDFFIEKKEFSSFLQNVYKISNYTEDIRNIQKEAMKVDTQGGLYYSYGYCRLQDALREFGMGTRSEVQKKINQLSYDYHPSSLESKKGEKKSLLDQYLERDSDFLELYSSFYYSLQLYQDHRTSLNLSWIKSINVAITDLKTWRCTQFGNTRKGIPKKQFFANLQKKFGNDASILYKNLVMSQNNVQPFPYMIEFDNVVYVNHTWAAWMEIVFQAEIDGDTVFQEWYRKFTKEFETKIVPNHFKNKGFQVGSRFEVKNPDGTKKYEYDVVTLDSSQTLWVIEAKCPQLKRRQMDRFPSWKEECIDYIEIPDKPYSFFDKVNYIKDNLKQLQSQRRIPGDWEINQVRGIVVTKLPPIEESYKGMPIIWYRELDVWKQQ